LYFDILELKENSIQRQKILGNFNREIFTQKKKYLSSKYRGKNEIKMCVKEAGSTGTG
jgi:hypothetical protein